MEDKTVKNIIRWIYTVGFLVILTLPLLTIPPYLFPPDFGKSIIFRSILAILLFLFVWQILYRKNEISLPGSLKKNPILWAGGVLFVIYLLASIFSVDPYFSFWGSPYRGGGFITFGFYFIFTVLAFIIFKKEDWQKAWNFSIIIAALVSLVAAVQYYGLFALAQTRPMATLGNTDLLAVYLLLISFITLTFAIREKETLKKISYIAAVCLFCYTILITGSREAYFGIAIAALYFLLLYPQKMKGVKMITAGALIILVGFVVYANTINAYPPFLQQNRLLNSLTTRLNIGPILKDPRFYTWTRIDGKIIMAKPILGYGPENFSVGFDKYYNPSIPYLGYGLGWWDRAHNIIIQTISDAGIFGLMAYLTLFVALFWQLQKVKSSAGENSEYNKNTLLAHGIQATLIGYFAANLFGFDSFSSYLIFFLLAAYSLYLIYDNNPPIRQNSRLKISPWKPITIAILFCLLAVFLWQYNILPFFINAQINEAQDLTNAGQCSQALGIMDNMLPEHSFLDSYARLEYTEFTKTCAVIFPQNSIGYTQKDVPLIQQAAAIQPLYTRYWIFLGSAESTLAGQENDPQAKSNLLNLANNDFQQALKLGPKYQEIVIAQAQMEIIAGNYQQMQQDAQHCVALNPELADCYWYLALSQIYQKNITDAKSNIQIAKSKGYNPDLLDNVNQLANAYGFISDYQDIIPVYQKLIGLNPDDAQYHSSLAFFYKETGDYADARKEALMVLELSPGSKPNVDAFLQALPQ